MSARAAERLRQEREAFELNKSQARDWFALQIRTGYVGVGLLVVIALGCVGALVNANTLGPIASGAAAVVLLGDIVAVVCLLIKMILAPDPRQRLEPVCRPVVRRGTDIL